MKYYRVHTVAMGVYNGGDDKGQITDLLNKLQTEIVDCNKKSCCNNVWRFERQS